MPRSSQQTQPMEGIPPGQRVLITTWPDETKLSVIGVLGQALRLRGADSRALLCDSALHKCEVLPQLGTEIAPFLASSKVNLCQWCFHQTETALRGFELPIFRLSDSIREDEYERSLEAIRDLTLSEILTYEHQGLKLGEHVRTSLLRFFLVHLAEDEATRAVALRYLATAIQLANGLGRLMDEFQPEVVVIFHGIYLIGGTCMEVVKSRGVRAVTWDLVYRRYCIQLSHGDTYHHEFRLEPWEAWENLQLSTRAGRAAGRLPGQETRGNAAAGGHLLPARVKSRTAANLLTNNGRLPNGVLWSCLPMSAGMGGSRWPATCTRADRMGDRYPAPPVRP